MNHSSALTRTVDLYDRSDMMSPREDSERMRGRLAPRGAEPHPCRARPPASPPPLARGPLPHPSARLRLRADLDDRVSGHELLRPGERPLDDRRLATTEL